MPKLLSIIELGGYPNLLPTYQKLGFDVEVVNSQRKARSALKKSIPDVIVAEYIFQTDFRDRTSNLETLMAVLQKHPDVKVVVFYLPEQAEKLAILEARFPLFAKISVRGEGMHPLYQYLTSPQANGEFGGPITWNFNKFLIGKEGTTIARFPSEVDPMDPQIIKAVEAALQ